MERPVQPIKQLHNGKELWKIAVKIKEKWKI
jgi:hypothetical protein